MMSKPSNTYRSAVDVAREYLGPAGERFMRRQIETHLRIAPERLSGKDIPELVTWSRLAFAMLTDDSGHIDAFTSDLSALSKRGSGEKSRVRGN